MQVRLGDGVGGGEGGGRGGGVRGGWLLAHTNGLNEVTRAYSRRSNFLPPMSSGFSMYRCTTYVSAVGLFSCGESAFQRLS